MVSGAPDMFISYSRVDSVFVDRLEADLRARGFDTWVDRRRLEGGSEWEQEIERAIERHSLTIVVLSPPSVQSPYVRFEYELALRLGRRIVPVLYQVCPIPSALERLQWIDFTGANEDARALKELVYACQDPTLSLTADSDTLYNQALGLEESDPERAVILFQRILDRDPGYFGGRVATDLQRLEKHLYDSRVARLRAQAEQARQRGEYGVEAGALDAIVALGPQDATIYAWAQEYLKVSQQNRALLGPYVVIRDRATDDPKRAKELLQDLWRQAPYFRDPAGVASGLGLEHEVPKTYEEVKERRLAEEAKAKELRLAKESMARETQDITAERDRLIVQAQSEADSAIIRENEQWSSARDLVEHAGDRAVPPNAQTILGANSDGFLDSLVRQGHQRIALEGQALQARKTADFLRKFWLLSALPSVLVTCASCVTVPSGADSVLSGFGVDSSNTPAPLGLIVALLEILICLIIGASPVLFALWLISRSARRSRELDRQVAAQKERIAGLITPWVTPAKAEHLRRLSDINNRRQRLSTEAQAYCERRVAQIAAEHDQIIAAITQRYQQI